MSYITERQKADARMLLGAMRCDLQEIQRRVRSLKSERDAYERTGDHKHHRSGPTPGDCIACEVDRVVKMYEALP